MGLESEIQSLHTTYVTMTGHQTPFPLCERRWFEWQKYFASDDLKLVIEYVTRLNRKREPQYRIPLRFGSIIGDLERFSDLLGESRADRRARDFKTKHSYPVAKASVLRATGRPDAPAVPENCISAAEAIRRLRESV